MIGLLKGEYYKLVRTVSFWVILAILMGIGISMPFLEKVLVEQMQNLSQEELDQVNAITESVPEGVSTGIQFNMQGLNGEGESNAITSLENAFSGNNLQLFIAIFATLFLIVEFSTGSVKIIVSKGFSRTKVFLAKLIAVCSANVLFVALFAISIFLSSCLVWGLGEVPEGFAGKLLTLIFLQLVGVIAYSTLALMVTMLIRSTALSLVVNIAVVALGSNVFFLLDWLTKRRFHITRYWIVDAMAESGRLSLTGGEVVRNLVTMVVTFAITYAIGVMVFQKADIKGEN